MDILRKIDGEISLSKAMASIAFVVAMGVVMVELFTNLNFQHMGEYLTFTGTLIALATGRSIADAKWGGKQ